MSTVSQDEVVDFFEQQDWEVMDVFSGENDEPSMWSVTAVTEDGVRIAIDDPIEEPRLNNIFVEHFVQSVTSLEGYKDLVDSVEEPVKAEVQSEDGLFMRAKHSTEVEMKEDGIVERLEEKGVDWGVRLVIVGCTQESSFDDVLSWVTEIRESKP